MKSKVKYNDHFINFDKKVYKGKRVIDFINELEPQVERIILQYKSTDSKPFGGSKVSLSKWLIANQEGYNKYVGEIYNYFVEKCKL